MKRLETRIIENKRIAQGFFRMRLESVYLAKNSQPGQFIEVKCSEGTEVLLRRPLGVHRIVDGGIEVLYEVIGKGTESLSRKKSGDKLDVIGPLGHGFSVPRSTINDKRSTILVAGGVGAAPLVALAQSLSLSIERRAYRKKQNIHVLIGAKTKSHILCEADFEKMGCTVMAATEDGSSGKKCMATDLLKKLLSAKRYPLNAIIYACGPNPMLKAVSKIAENHDIPCQVSMEERMACGVGVCLGCPVKVKSGGYKMVCKDGPVFNARDIVW